MRRASFVLLTVLDILLVPAICLWVMGIMSGGNNAILSDAFRVIVDIFSGPAIYLRRSFLLYVCFALLMLLYIAGIIWDVKKRRRYTVGYYIYEAVIWIVSFVGLGIFEAFYQNLAGM